MCHPGGMSEATAGDGTKIYWDQAGQSAAADGASVLLVHGITECWANWQPIIDRLESSHRVLWMDLRGHGQSANADRYDLEAMAGDVVTVATAAGLERPHLVGHSLGGAVVSAVGAVLPVRSVTNVDQSLQLGEFKAQLVEVEDHLKDPDAFPLVLEGLFAQLEGDKLSTGERDRLAGNRRANQDVVLGVWEMMFTMSAQEIAAVVEGALSGYAGQQTPYLSLFGVDPGEAYADWLAGFIRNSSVEVWDDHGHYPHLVDPDRFVDRLKLFWAS